MADLFRRAGDAGRADALTREAQELRERFNRDFWLDDKGVNAVCLQGKDNRPAETVTWNAGKVLWSGIAARAAPFSILCFTLPICPTFAGPTLAATASRQGRVRSVSRWLS